MRPFNITSPVMDLYRDPEKGVSMVTRQDIQATCDDIVREFAPLQVILFGSYAYGTPREYSDVDLLVVMAIPKSETRPPSNREIRERIPRPLQDGFVSALARRDCLSPLA